MYGRRWMRSGDLGARLRWDAGRTGPSPPFLAPPIRMDAKTFSYFIFYWCFFFFFKRRFKSDSLLLRNSSEMRDNLTRHLLTLPVTD